MAEVQEHVYSAGRVERSVEDRKTKEDTEKSKSIMTKSWLGNFVSYCTSWTIVCYYNKSMGFIQFWISEKK